MGAKGRKSRATLSRGALLHEGTRLIKGPRISKIKTSVICFLLLLKNIV